MVRLLLGLDEVPQPHDASDALAVAICHVHTSSGPVRAAEAATPKSRRMPRSWREYRP
jgi:Holliday junction resolvasome RuvABC endonuclease subunit